MSKKLITEKLGVAEPTLPYITIVYEELKGKTINFYNSDLDSYKEQVIISLKDMSFIYKEYLLLILMMALLCVLARAILAATKTNTKRPRHL